MRIYISLPITGQDMAEVMARVETAKAEIKEKGHTPVSPLDQDNTQDYATLMGNDLRMLLKSDAAVFLQGWGKSRGCKLEHSAATIYGLEIFYKLDRITENAEYIREE